MDEGRLMANLLLGRTGNNLTDETGVVLLNDDESGGTVVPPTEVFPLFLGLRLRLHVMWLLFVLIPL
jgi:hypothetical protein